MFKSRIQRARDKINSEGYYRKRLSELADQIEYWNRFEQFECSKFFRGWLKAEMNTKKYLKNITRLNGKINWYKRKIRE